MVRAARTLCLIFTLAFLTSAIPCQAAFPTLSASAYVLLDAESGRVLAAKNETEERAIASTTKIMTALVALRSKSLTDIVDVRREHLREGSSMYLAAGETLTVEALLYGLMLPSGNDAAECLADCCGPGRDAFVVSMNETAAALGMEHTTFRNPSGLDEAGHCSCALDMARLMAFAMRDDTFARIVSTTTATAGTRTMANHNKLLGRMAGCVGGKTGYTGAAGRTLVTCAERDGLRLIAVTLNDGSDWADHKALYEYGFATYHAERVLSRGEDCALAAVRGGTTSWVTLRASEGVTLALAEGETAEVRCELDAAPDAPVLAGQKLGEAVVLLDGAELARVSLVAAQAVERAEYKPPWWRR